MQLFMRQSGRVMPSSALTTQTLTGIATAFFASSIFGDVFPDNIALTAVYGGLGGMARWIGVRRIKWHENLSWVPLGVILAVGLDTITAPLLTTYLNGTEEGFLWQALKSEDATRGLAFLVGLSGTAIIAYVMDRLGTKKDG